MEASLGGLSAAKPTDKAIEQERATIIGIRLVILFNVTSQFVA